MIGKRIVRWLSAALTAVALICAAVPGAVYADGERTLSLTEEEQAYIDSCGTLKVGYVQDRIPVSFVGEDGQLAGVSRYIFDRL